MRFLSTLLLALLPMAAAADGFSEGDIVAGKLVCQTEAAILHVANADQKNLQAVQFALTFQQKRGKCMVLPRPHPVVLKEKVHAYTDFDGAETEVWLIEGDVPYFILVVVPGPQGTST